MTAESHTSVPMPSIISKDQSVEERRWLLSLVKSEAREHAFLLLEEIYKGVPRYLRSDLSLMQTPPLGAGIRDAVSNTWQQLVGQRLCYVKNIDPEEYGELLSACQHQTWSITRPQAEKLMAKLQQEQESSLRHPYIISGYHPSSLVNSRTMSTPLLLRPFFSESHERILRCTNRVG